MIIEKGVESNLRASITRSRDVLIGKHSVPHTRNRRPGEKAICTESREPTRRQFEVNVLIRVHDQRTYATTRRGVIGKQRASHTWNRRGGTDSELKIT